MKRHYFAIFVLVGCGPMAATLNPNAKNIKVVGPDSVKDCTFVGAVSSRAGGNFQSFEKNVDIVMTELMNQAAAKGGTHLVADPPRASEHTPYSAGNGRCVNCVEGTGMAYSCSMAR